MSGREWIVGIHSVTELLRRNPEDVFELVLQQERADQRLDEVRALATELGIKIQVMPKAALEKKLLGEGKGEGKGDGRRIPVHQGVAALCQWRDTVKDEAFLNKLLTNLDHPALILVSVSYTHLTLPTKRIV